MKNFRKLAALLLALCMMLSLSVAAYAAEDDCAGHIDWSLDGGTLHISGHGKIAPFASRDDQPWKDVREEITAVNLDPSAHMQISDAAYWFAGCTNLEVCQLPSFTDLGADTFKDCAKLEILMLYYHDEAFQIADSAFSGVDADALVVLTDDLVTQTALEQRGFTVVSAYDSDLLAGNCGITGCNCSSCSYTYSYEPKDASRHYIWECCTKCSANEYAYRHTGSHSFNSRGVCTLCGYAEEVSCSHTSTRTTWNGCNWTKICNNCGETVDWGTTHGSYSYGAWQYYTTSQHRRYGTCNDCGGGGKYEYGSHSTTTQYAPYNDTQHKVTKHCTVCDSDIGSSSTQNHSLSYGSWTSTSSTQHRRTKSCAACGYSGTEYGDHVDGNKDGKCDTCGYSMAVTLTWDCGGAKTLTTSQPIGAKLILPTEPTKDGYTFLGWFTAASGGSRVDENTIFTASSPTTYYAQWEKIEVFSVTVPVTLPLAVDENGAVHTASAEILNNSTGAVKVTGVTLTAKNGWQLVPFDADMARAKVDARQIGFAINNAQTTKSGSAEALALAQPWSIPEAGTLPLDYSAKVSAVSQPVTGQDVLEVVFVLEWAEE